MSHILSLMSLTGLTNHESIIWNHSFSLTGDAQSEVIDPGKSSIRNHIFPYGTNGGVRRCYDVYHGAP